MYRSPHPLRVLTATFLLGASAGGAAAAPAPTPPALATAPTATPAPAASSPAAAGHALGAALPEPAITLPGVEGDYLRAMHSAIHFRWATRFVDWVASKRPPNDRLNNPTLVAEVLFSVRWDGSPAQVTVSSSSGVAEFDEAAVAAVKSDSRYPVPPIDVYGDDGVAHFQWTFARDHRLCSGGQIRRSEAPLREALPRLFVQGRMKEALLRVARYTRGGDPDAMSEFARAYLARPFPDPMTDARAAAGLARADDARAADRLRAALARPETMPIAAPALAALKIDLCALVGANLKPSPTEPALVAARTLRAAGVELAPDSSCVSAMTAIVKDAAVHGAVRAEMLDTLAAVNPNGVRRLALDALGDADAKMRAAGVRAFARPKGGRPTLYRLQPLINDPSLEVRAAVAAGLVRACGDLANDYIQPLFKARDLPPLVAMAGELGKSSSPASADLLARLQKRPEPDLRMPVLAALAARQDPAGRALYQPAAETVKKDPYASPEARRIVYAGADASELVPLGKDPLLGVFAYKALLRAHRHTEALDWLVGAYDRLTPDTLVDALGAWLANPPARGARK
jgi:TonB family protein